MPAKYSKQYKPNQTPQSEPIRADQVKNEAGGYVWAVDDDQKLNRFLILGNEGGSYYVNEKTMTRKNAQAVIRLIKADPIKVIDRISEISVQGRAHKNDAALFALALVFAEADKSAMSAAGEALLKVARTSYHLFTFLEYIDDAGGRGGTKSPMRGWGPALKRAVANWYQTKSLDRLAFQISKYGQRGGWSHANVLSLAHPNPTKAPVLKYEGKTEGEYVPGEAAGLGPDTGASRSMLYKFIGGKLEDKSVLPKSVADYLSAVEEVKGTASASKAVKLVQQFKLPLETLRTELQRDPKVWDALLDQQIETNSMTALIRNLATMTRVGLVKEMSNASKRIVAAVTDIARLQRARIHPIQVLAALLTYKAGRSAFTQRGHVIAHQYRRGDIEEKTWTPVRAVLDALDEAFYLTFDNVERVGKPIVLGIDTSGSMQSGTVGDIPGLTPHLASAALALITARTEPDYAIVGFTTRAQALSISPRQRLDDVVEHIRRVSVPEGTDCALPMQWATGQNIGVDAFVLYTDGQTWAGSQHPVEALNVHRKKFGRESKLVQVAMIANERSIADPTDPNQLDVVGFSTDCPLLINEFIAGRI